MHGPMEREEENNGAVQRKLHDFLIQILLNHLLTINFPDRIGDSWDSVSPLLPPQHPNGPAAAV